MKRTREWIGEQGLGLVGRKSEIVASVDEAGMMHTGIGFSIHERQRIILKMAADVDLAGGSLFEICTFIVCFT